MEGDGEAGLEGDEEASGVLVRRSGGRWNVTARHWKKDLKNKCSGVLDGARRAGPCEAGSERAEGCRPSQKQPPAP